VRPSGLAVFDSTFGREQAERLLWRAGFGPARGEAAAVAKQGLKKAVARLLHPPGYGPSGRDPTDSKGRPLAPQDAVGHDHAYWLDRMVRGNQPLVERMALVWHDWFATSNQGVNSQALMLKQSDLFRAHWAGSFRELVVAVTSDPAMLLWLDGTKNRAGRPNENYGRELMELFTLGAYQGYNEQDVREQARALTGWRNDNSRVTGPTNFRYDPNYHDNGAKTVFGRTAAWGWADACNLAVQNSKHPPFLVRKLWSYFIPLAELDARTAAALESTYTSTGYRVAPLLKAIFLHPALFTGPRMVKGPVVYTAGLLRAVGRGVDTTDWARLDGTAGQRLFYPPNVAGWDDDRWLDTQTYRARWAIAATVLQPFALEPTTAPVARVNTPDAILKRALAFWDNPTISRATQTVLKSFAQHALADAGSDATKRRTYPAMVENALRQLIVVTPDYLTC
jgi:uncharacterized protein (DUF1800 family)